MKNFYTIKLKVLCAIVFVLALSNVSNAQLIINEVLPWPAGSSAPTPVDANNDGTTSAFTDEFVELVNVSGGTLDISGWSVWDGPSGSNRFTFPSGTILAAGEAILVFGGYTGTAPATFNGSRLFLGTTPSAGLGLVNTGDAIEVRNGATVIDTYAYPSATSGTSFVRTTEPDGTSAFTVHPTLNSKFISPGTKKDGTPFITKVKFASLADSKNENGGNYDLVVSLEGASPTVATTFDLVLTSTHDDDVDFQVAHTVAAGETQITIPITIVDDALLEGNEQVTFSIQNVSGGISAVSYTPSTFTLTLLDNDITSVSFVSASATVAEGAGTYQLAVSIQSPSPTLATSVEVVLTTGNAGTDITYSTQVVTFPANTSANRTVTVTIVNNTEVEADETFTFSLQNQAQPGGSAEIGAISTFTLNVDDDDVSPLKINEFCAFPSASGTGVDANGDGNINGNNDEFIELVNAGASDLDLSGWAIYAGAPATLRFTFDAGTVLEPGEALVVFGGWHTGQSPAPLKIGGSRVFFGVVSGTANTGLGLSNTGTTIQVKNTLGVVQTEYTYAEAETVSSVSRVLDPEITGNTYIAHPALAGKTISPGTKADGANFIDATLVSFTAGSASVKEADGTYVLKLSISHPHATNATSATVALTQGDAADLGGFQPATVNFAGGVSADQTVTITLHDDATAESNKVFTFALQNVQGGSNATVGAISTFTLTVVDDDAVPGQLVVINEIHPRLELAPNGDTNGDGTRSTTNDEFIEFINISAGELDISGWRVMTGSGTGTLQHIFPEATVVPAGGAVLLFGGPDPDEGAFGGSVVQTADDGTGAIGLSLTDQSATVRLLDASGVQQDEVTYFSESSSFAGISIVRIPDGGAFTLDAQQRAIANHPSVLLNDGRQHQYSAGIKSDGTPFIEITTTTVQFATAAGGRYEQDASPSPVAVTVERAHATQPTTFEIGLVTPDPDSELSFSPSSFTFTPGEPETQYINIVINDDLALEGDEVFVLQIKNVSGGDHAAPGKNKTFQFRIYDNDMPVIFNEVHAAPASDISGDANHDGARSASEDEFVELVNVTDEVIDMGGWKLYSGSDVLRHVFLPGTKLEPRKALVVFGGGIPLGFFGGSKFQLASESGLGLTDNGTALVLRNVSGELQSSFTYGTDGNIKQSLTRSPDITGYYVPHAQAENANGVLFSPGIKANGWPFGDLTTGILPKAVSAVSFYPNPARTSATLVITQTDLPFDYVIADVTGRTVRQARAVTGEASVNLEGLHAGLYFYTVRGTGNGKTLGKGTFIVIH